MKALFSVEKFLDAAHPEWGHSVLRRKNMGKIKALVHSCYGTGKIERSKMVILSIKPSIGDEMEVPGMDFGAQLVVRKVIIRKDKIVVFCDNGFTG